MLLAAIACAGIVACVRTRPHAPGAIATFSAHRWPTGGDAPFGITVTDFNGDGHPDLAVSHAGSGNVVVLLGEGDGRFAPGPTFPVGIIARGIVAADLNADGHSDLVVANLRSNQIVAWLGDGRGGATRKEYYSGGLAPFNEDVADIDGDGNLDILVANESDITSLEGRGQVTVLFGDGHGNMPGRVALQAGSYPADAKIADFDGDGRMDLAILNWKSQDVSLFFGRGNRAFAGAPAVPLGRSPAYTLAVGDLNRDGHPDLVSGDLDGIVYLRINDGHGGFSAAPSMRAGSGLRDVIVTDLNGDRLPDIVTVNVSADTISIFYGKPGGGFVPQQIPVGHQPRWVAAADLNHDGTVDLAVANGGSNDVSVLLNTGFQE